MAANLDLYQHRVKTREGGAKLLPRPGRGGARARNLAMEVLAALSLLAAPAVAQTAQVDTAQVDDCFAGARVGGGAPACAGDAANVCQTRPGGDTTLGITECLMAERDVWYDLMTAELGEQAENLRRDRAELVTELHHAQDAWSAYRDAECGLLYSIWIDGSIRTIMAADCHLQKTAARVVELRDLGGM